MAMAFILNFGAYHNIKGTKALTPLYIHQLHQPKNAARQIAARSQGFGTLLLFLAVEWCLSMPLDIASAAMRFTYSLPQGLILLWNHYFRFAFNSIVMIYILAAGLYYLSRQSRFERHDIGSFASLLAYSYFAFILMLCAGSILGKFGLPYPLSFTPYLWLQNHSSLAQAIHLILYFAPSAALAIIGTHHLLTKTPQETPTSQPTPLPLTLLCITLLSIALLMNGQYIKDNWQKVRPPMPGDALGVIPKKALDGSVLARQDLTGKIVMLDFWATWCPPCVAAMPHIKKLNQDFKDQDFVLISINTEPNNMSEVKEFIAAQALDFPVFVDNGQVQTHYRIETFPTVLIYDHKGMLQYIHTGSTSIHNLKQEIETLIDAKH